MQKLYGAKGAGSVASQATMRHLGVEFEMIFIDFGAEEHHCAEFLAINPRGQIPALVLDDGSILTESSAILLHMADTHGSANLIGPLGSFERAQCYRWLSFMATNAYAEVLHYEYPQHYTTDENHASVVQSAKNSMGRTWGILNEAIAGRRTLIGERTGIVDIYMAMLMCWHHDPDALHRTCGNLRAALDNTMQLDAVADVFRENELI